VLEGGPEFGQGRLDALLDPLEALLDPLEAQVDPLLEPDEVVPGATSAQPTAGRCSINVVAASGPSTSSSRR